MKFIFGQENTWVYNIQSANLSLLKKEHCWNVFIIAKWKNCKKLNKYITNVWVWHSEQPIESQVRICEPFNSHKENLSPLNVLVTWFAHFQTVHFVLHSPSLKSKLQCQKLIPMCPNLLFPNSVYKNIFSEVVSLLKNI